MRKYFVYILTDQQNGVLYTGVTNNLYRRINEHHENNGSKFTKKYHTKKLVYYEEFPDVLSAITREKQIKGGSRVKKIDLINKVNPEWKNLNLALEF